jgi:hypothetical protein
MLCNLTYMLIRFRLGYKNIDIKRRLTEWKIKRENKIRERF